MNSTADLTDEALEEIKTAFDCARDKVLARVPFPELAEELNLVLDKHGLTKAQPRSSGLDLNSVPFKLVDTADGNKVIDEGWPTSSPMDIDLDNYGTLTVWIQNWMNNMRLCAPLVTEDFAKRDSNAYMFEDYIERKPERPDLAVVLGSGPSLNESAKLLKDFPGYIFAGPTNASIAARYGAVPHAIIAIDSGSSTSMQMAVAPFDRLGSWLITNPSIDYDAAASFKKRLWFCSLIQMGGSAQHPFNLFQKMLFSPVVAWMYQAGCVVNAALLFLHMLSVKRERYFKRIFLLGTDFCYRKNASRCKSFTYREDGTWYQRDVMNPSDRILTRARLTRSRNGLVTDEAMLGYKRSLLTIWQIAYLRLYDGSDGILTEIPKADFNALTRTQDWDSGVEDYSDEFVTKTLQDYLNDTGYDGKKSGNEGKPIEDLEKLW